MSQQMVFQGEALFTFRALIRPEEADKQKCFTMNMFFSRWLEILITAAAQQLTCRLNATTNVCSSSVCARNLYRNECKRADALLLTKARKKC